MLLREERSGAKDRYTITQITREKKRGKRNASIESVELMDNVSPLWCWKAGRMYLQCVFKTQAEHLRKWGLEFAECTDCVPPWGVKRAWKLSPVLNFDLSVCLSPPTNLLSLYLVIPPHTKSQTTLISMKASSNVTGVIHTSQELSDWAEPHLKLQHAAFCLTAASLSEPYLRVYRASKHVTIKKYFI